MNLDSPRKRSLWRTLLQMIKFGLVGASNTLISMAVYYGFVWIYRDYYLAGQVAGFLLSVLNAY